MVTINRPADVQQVPDEPKQLVFCGAVWELSTVPCNRTHTVVQNKSDHTAITQLCGLTEFGKLEHDLRGVRLYWGKLRCASLQMCRASLQMCCASL